MSDTFEASGSCLCGATRLTAKATSRSVGACHCGMCRKWTGGPLLAVDCGTEVSLEGGENIACYASSDWAERGFCKQCGSHLFYRLKQSGQYIVPAGLLDGDAALHFDHQIFIDRKPDYYSFANPTEDMTEAEVFAKYMPPST
ncbi:GFA family protein [Marinobacterium arenosum]|uniref:GFA family protein n=1 Tax=Marinobacterium arenosum TaxID=2862496 RepID=UPI001C963F79|nr:GFA family protein [Marinobacterium arenosum]MBY4675425.1 GFA family protein [Marinobacterium arenosum]